MRDLLTEKAFCEPERWTEVIDQGVGKRINKRSLRNLCDAKERARLYIAIRDGNYEFKPPRTAKLKKDVPGEYRTVYINDDYDRVILSVDNNLLFELCGDYMIDDHCVSYQKGLSASKTVEEMSKIVASAYKKLGPGVKIGFKADLSKYFDSVPIEFIDKAFDKVESFIGKSKMVDVLRKYYHCDLYYDCEDNYALKSKYQSLKQGCAVASFLADVIPFDMDKKMGSLKGFYVRYSDDIVYIGPDYEQAMKVLKSELAKLGLKLNPKKVSSLYTDEWFTFLGFSLRRDKISLSKKSVKHFVKQINAATTKKKSSTYESAIRDVDKFLYRGFEDFNWARYMLRTINDEHDLDVLNSYVMDAIRAATLNRTHIGGIGYHKEQKEGCLQRGTGRNVKSNRERMPKLDEYHTMKCMQIALRTNTSLFETLIRVELK